MVKLDIQDILTFGRWSGLFALPCLSEDERRQRGFSEPRGHLSNDSRIEALLQALLLFGPPAFLLIGAPIKIFQLYHAKLVTVPNCQGLVKLVSDICDIP
jgi:hypothetical protein